ncbi:MAG: hypothetical protein FJ145_04790 [Deltaproteobacteria bacterium]|nr:hypothetical protein [Deltaproteobacteria bacterium]
MKDRPLLLSAVLLPIALVIFIVGGGQDWLRARFIRWAEHSESTGASIAAMKELLANDQRLLVSHEKAQSALRAEVVRQRKLLQDGGTDKAAVTQAEQAFVASLRKVHEMQAQVLEIQIAITEAVLGAKVDRFAMADKNNFRETENFARFSGGANWSLRDAPAIQNYFVKTFGYNLPVSAYGQSPTHNRLGFDHRNAMDVALYPDSTEGRALINYLRQAGIPFIVFKSAVLGASTGPHIHIGRPSGWIGRR